MPKGIYLRTKPSKLKGVKLSEERKAKMSFFNKGRKPWNKDLKGFGIDFGFQKGHKFLGGGNKKGDRTSIRTEFKQGIIPWNKGVHGVNLKNLDMRFLMDKLYVKNGIPLSY